MHFPTRYYVKLQSVEPLYSKGIKVFQDLVFEKVKVPVKAALLHLVEADRELRPLAGDQLIKGVVDMFIDLGIGADLVVYSDLERDLLDATGTYYHSTKCEVWLGADSFSDYLLKSEQALQQEEDRCGRWLHRSTLGKLKAVVIEALLQKPQSKVKLTVVLDYG